MLQTDRELAVLEALDRAIEQARINKELLAAEEAYRSATEIARARSLRLATASHNNRQPLSSLRTSFAALADAKPEETQHLLQNSLDDLGALVAGYLDEAAAFEGRADSEASAQGKEKGDSDAGSLN